MTNKLPIPRLLDERRESSGRRISRACDACRARKTKCDGDRPRCTQCAAQGIDKCFYPDRKIVRLQRELDSERSKTQAYEDVLQDLSLEFEGPIANRIRKVLRVCLYARAGIRISTETSVAAGPTGWSCKSRKEALQFLMFIVYGFP